MKQTGEPNPSRSINWIAVILLGLVLPAAVAIIVSWLVPAEPRAPQGGTPAAAAPSVQPPAAPQPDRPSAPAAPPPASSTSAGKPATAAASAPPRSPVGPPIAKPASTPEGKPESKPEAGTAASGSDKGKAVYVRNCAACHAAGVAGAPKLGDKGAWAPRIKEGNAALHRTAIKGIRAMPPRGGNATLSDEDVKAAVDYMIAEAK